MRENNVCALSERWKTKLEDLRVGYKAAIFFYGCYTKGYFKEVFEEKP